MIGTLYMIYNNNVHSLHNRLVTLPEDSNCIDTDKLSSQDPLRKYSPTSLFRIIQYLFRLTMYLLAHCQDMTIASV